MLAKRILVAGASSAIAAECLRNWSREPVHALLVGRSEGKLQAQVDDLRVHSPDSTFDTAVIDLLDPRAIAATVGDFAQSGAIDIALVAQGVLGEQQACQRSLELLADTYRINSLSPILFAEALAAEMERAGRGCLGIIGSVAGDRGRRSNYAYGAAKAALDRYAQGLQHRFAGTGVKVCLIKPGPTATPMTDHLVGSGPSLAPVEAVAALITAGMARGRAVIYAPRRWALIMLVIRHLPRFVFNRLDI